MRPKNVNWPAAIRGCVPIAPRPIYALSSVRTLDVSLNSFTDNICSSPNRRVGLAQLMFCLMLSFGICSANIIGPLSRNQEGESSESEPGELEVGFQLVRLRAASSRRDTLNRTDRQAVSALDCGALEASSRTLRLAHAPRTSLNFNGFGGPLRT